MEQAVDGGKVVEMKRKLTAQVNRFGHTFKVEYRAGPTREQSDTQAALYLDGKLIGWLQAGFHLDSWSELYLQPVDDEFWFVRPEMLGLPPETEREDDLYFMREAEMYIVGLLNDDITNQLVEKSNEYEPEECDGVDDQRFMSPSERALRAVEVWHNHGQDAKLLPQLIAIEVYDALDSMGYALAQTIDEMEIEPGQCGDAITHLVATALTDWRSADTMEEDDDESEREDG